MAQECTESTVDTGEDRFLVTCSEAARLLSINMTDVHMLCKDGTLRRGRHGRRLLIQLDSVRNYALSVTA